MRRLILLALAPLALLVIASPAQAKKSSVFTYKVSARGSNCETTKAAKVCIYNQDDNDRTVAARKKIAPKDGAHATINCASYKKRKKRRHCWVKIVDRGKGCSAAEGKAYKVKHGKTVYFTRNNQFDWGARNACPSTD